MSPSPDKTDDQQPTAEQSQAAPETPPTRGLQLEARVTSTTWEIGLAAVVQDFTPGEVILILDDKIASGTHVTIQMNTCAFDGVILFCEPSGARWETQCHSTTWTPRDCAGRLAFRSAFRHESSRARARVRSKARSSMFRAKDWEWSWPRPSRSKPTSRCRARKTRRSAWFAIAGNFLPDSFGSGIQLLHIVRKDLDLEKASAESGWMNKLGVRFGRKKADRPKGWS